MKTKLTVLLLVAASSILAQPPGPCAKTGKHPIASTAPKPLDPPGPCLACKQK